MARVYFEAARSAAFSSECLSVKGREPGDDGRFRLSARGTSEARAADHENSARQERSDGPLPRNGYGKNHGSGVPGVLHVSGNAAANSSASCVAREQTICHRNSSLLHGVEAIFPIAQPILGERWNQPKHRVR